MQWSVFNLPYFLLAHLNNHRRSGWSNRNLWKVKVGDIYRKPFPNHRSFYANLVIWRNVRERNLLFIAIITQNNLGPNGELSHLFVPDEGGTLKSFPKIYGFLNRHFYSFSWDQIVVGTIWNESSGTILRLWKGRKSGKLAFSFWYHFLSWKV